MIDQLDHEEAVKQAVKVAEAYAGSSANNHLDTPDIMLEKVYRVIIKLTEESRK